MSTAEGTTCEGRPGRVHRCPPAARLLVMGIMLAVASTTLTFSELPSYDAGGRNFTFAALSLTGPTPDAPATALSKNATAPKKRSASVAAESPKLEEMCESTCCVTETRQTLVPYDATVGNASAFPSIEDRIGIFETMKFLPEVLYHDAPTKRRRTFIDKLQKPRLSRAIVPCLRRGAVIAVEGCALDRFFDRMYPLLTEPFVLFSMNCDHSAPGKYAMHLEGRDGNATILHWYAANCDADARGHARLTCVPVGLAHEIDQKHALDRALSAIPDLTYDRGRPRFPPRVEDGRTGLALASYRIHPRFSPRERRELTDRLFGSGRERWEGENVTRVNANVSVDSLNGLKELYELSLGYKFMLSPHGNGLDCYRTWESLFLGMVPVVQTSTLDSMYEGLPVLIVGKWSDLTPELLHGTWERFRHQSFDFSTLYVRTWQIEMNRFRDDPRLSYVYRPRARPIPSGRMR